VKQFEPLYRPGSSDEIIWREVFFQDDYRLPSFSSEALVIDVGAHTGAFVCACLAKGARRVVAFEPDIESFMTGKTNIMRYLQFSKLSAEVDFENSAVWRSDRMEQLWLTKPLFSSLTNSVHYAAQSTVFRSEQGYAVPSIALDAVLRMHVGVDLLKLDCEGAEWPILFTCTELFRLKRLYIEVHSLAWKAYELGHNLDDCLCQEFGRYSLPDLVEHLSAFGLRCTEERIHRNIFSTPEFYFGQLLFIGRDADLFT
jgi:FkbM family methyltransferase